MGEFVSNVARLLDETKTKDFMAGKLEATIEFAKRLIQKGFSDEEIAELTELEIERIKELRKSMLN
nr:hypothetical protein [Caldicellulosiruptor hydrothermalis]